MGVTVYAICSDEQNQKSMESRMLEESGWTEPRGFLGPLAFEWSRIFEDITGCNLHVWYEYCDDKDLASTWLEHAHDKYGASQLSPPYLQIVRWLEICSEHNARYFRLIVPSGNNAGPVGFSSARSRIAGSNDHRTDPLCPSFVTYDTAFAKHGNPA
jgi:hypothetical protein